MQLTISIDPSWLSSPAVLTTILAEVRQLELPAPTIAATEEDTSTLTSGMDDPEPAPAVAPAPTTPYKPPLATPESRRPPATPRYDGVPTTGQGLYRWACDRKVLPKINAVGKAHGWPRLVTHWDENQCAAAVAELNAAAPGAYATAAPVNGRTR